jgi:hypothetical protein
MSLKPSVLTVITAISIASAIADTRSTYAQASAFTCAVDNAGTPTTFAQAQNGTVPIFRWTSGYFDRAGYTPERRCSEVTERMATFKAQGQLSQLTSGVVRGQPVICAGNSCLASGDNILFTLKPGQSANQVLQEISANRQGASGPSAQLSGSGNETSPDTSNSNSTPTPTQTTNSLNVITHNQDGTVTFDLDRYLSGAQSTTVPQNLNNSQNSPATNTEGNSDNPLNLPSSENTENPSFPQTTPPSNSGDSLDSQVEQGTSGW